MKAILEFAGYTKIVELKEAKTIYFDKFQLQNEKVELPFTKIGEKEVDGELVALYSIFDPKRDVG